MSFYTLAGLVVAFVCSLLGSSGVRADEASLESEKQIGQLNKHAVKTIQTDYGQLYDCVDFYKQPAFDHPLLRNYTFGMKSRFLKQNKNEAMADSRRLFNIGLENGGCPAGMVPIKRVKKEYPIKEEKLMAERLNGGGVHYAVVQALSNKFTGAEGYFSVYAPQTQEHQYSSSRIKIQNGINGNEFIAFGWTVDPTRYGDTTAHLYVQTNTNSAKCYDVQCGFVLVAQDLSPGLPFISTSVPGNITLETRIFASRIGDGNWWLGVSNGDKLVYLGFWPHNLFSDLADFGTFVDWGGEVYSPPGIPGPAMGSGVKARDTVYGSYIRSILVLDINKTPTDPDTVKFADDADEYDVTDIKNAGGYWNHLVLFGGSSGGTMP